ncbi:hypothetical protein AB1K62_07475 [Parasphingorhabdus sp. JC815]|uniref:hypothetical protein n=1 Tax=Parasphingorhabdus sp. JC815 TaxID=3232140 RepID=UPI003457C5D3
MAYTGKYESPSELMSDNSLSDDEKIEMLEEWRNDKEALMRASDEGMQGEVQSNFLKKIENALLSLNEKSSSQ